jgi:hypothetical protein
LAEGNRQSARARAKVVALVARIGEHALTVSRSGSHRDALQGDLGIARLAEAKLGGDRAEVGVADGEDDIGAVLDPDAFDAGGHGAPLTVPAVGVGVIRGRFQAEQVGLIGAERGKSPGHAAVEADEEGGLPGTPTPRASMVGPLT